MTTKILLPLKFTPGIAAALAMALRMAKEFEGHLHILHVLDYRVHNSNLTDGQLAEFCQDAERKFQEQYRFLFGDFEDFSFSCCNGHPAAETAKFARHVGAEFIILGCHTTTDRPALSRLGETTLCLLQWAPCSVVTVPCEVRESAIGVDKLKTMPVGEQLRK